jgi:PAS domain-containing protein
MPETDEEDALLRSVALQNARTILLARQRAEKALERQSEWLRITLSSIGDAVISTDAEGRATFLNGVAESLTGWSQADAVGRRRTISAGRLSNRSRTNPPAR